MGYSLEKCQETAERSSNARKGVHRTGVPPVLKSAAMLVGCAAKRNNKAAEEETEEVSYSCQDTCHSPDQTNDLE